MAESGTQIRWYTRILRIGGRWTRECSATTYRRCEHRQDDLGISLRRRSGTSWDQFALPPNLS